MTTDTLPKGWTEVALGEVCSDVRSGFASGDDLEDGVLQLRMNNVSAAGQMNFDKQRRVGADDKQLRTFSLVPGDVLFNATNSAEMVGKTALFTGRNEPVLFSNHFLRLRCEPATLDPAFLARWLTLQFERRVFEHGCRRWVNQATYDKPSLLGLRMPLPPVEEQRRIAAVLDQADALRTKRRAALALLDAITESIFVDRISGIAPTRSLGEHLSFLTSGARGWAKYYRDEGSRFVRSLDVRMNSISDTDPAWVDAPDTAEARRIHVRAGDVLLTITGSRIGRVAEAPPDLDGAFISQHVAILRLDEALSPGFLARYLSLRSGGQRQIQAAQYGQTKPGLNFDQIRAFTLPDVDRASQDRLVAEIERAGQLAQTAISAGTRADELFSSLQQRAFRGEL